ncbi:lipoprotein [Actinoplanes cyaneus]|uniref:Lipoprotein n=1 Tax=Actinoplanes cyaneus TaxID=52696 RepID=A0A919MB68_9ACTN|nr:lipoprotein [Actinoplanes cyaneus]
MAALTISAALLSGCGLPNDPNAPKPTASVSSDPAGNGVEVLSGKGVLDKSRIALRSAKSFHVKGVVKEEKDLIQLDLKNAGDDFTGSLKSSGATIEVLSVAGQKYIRPDAKFWERMDSTGATATAMKQQVGTKWIKLAAKDADFGTIFAAADIDAILNSEGVVTKGETEDVDGVPALAVRDSADAASTLWVSTRGEPYPLKLEGPAGQGLTFSDFGKTFPEIKEPAASEFVDQSKLGKK